MSWTFLGSLDFTAVISRTSKWTVSPSKTWLRIRFPSTGHTNTKEYSNQSETESVRTRFSPCPLRTTLFTFTWINRMLELVAFPIQQLLEGKRIISFNSKIFGKSEQKISTLHRELYGIVSALQTYEDYIIGSPFPIHLYCEHEPILYLWRRKGQLSHRFSRYQVIITKFQNLEIIRTPGSKLAFPDILSQNLTVEEYQKHQLQHKKKPRDIEFYDEHGSPPTYRIQHDDNPNHTGNDFYLIHCQQGNDNKVIRLHNHGENFTLNSLSDQFPSTTIQSATDCFRLGKTINQFRCLCLHSTLFLSSVEDSEPTYSSINSLKPNEDNDSLDVLHDADDDAITDDDEDNPICEINTHADHYRLCKAKAAHDVVSGKIDFPGKEAANSYWGTSLGYQILNCKTRWCC